MTKKEKLLTKENEELLGYNANLHDDLQKANEKINLLRDSNKGLSNQLNRNSIYGMSESGKAIFTDGIKLIKRGLEKDIEKLRNENEAHKFDKTRLKEQVSVLNEAFIHEKNEKGNEYLKNVNLRETVSSLRGEINILHLKKKDLANEVCVRTGENEALRNEGGIMINKIEELRNQRDVWRDGFGVQSNANESLRAEGKKVNEELGKRCIELEKQVEKLTQDRLDWKGMTESMTKKYKKLLEEQGNLIMDSKKARASNVNVHPTMDCSDDNLVVLYIGDPEIYTVDSFEQAVREVTELTANGREGVIARILAKVESKPEEFTYDPYTAN